MCVVFRSTRRAASDGRLAELLATLEGVLAEERETPRQAARLRAARRASRILAALIPEDPSIVRLRWRMELASPR